MNTLVCALGLWYEKSVPRQWKADGSEPADTCMISGFPRDIDEICPLLGYYAV
jgi:hypothetical protein